MNVECKFNKFGCVGYTLIVRLLLIDWIEIHMQLNE